MSKETDKVAGSARSKPVVAHVVLAKAIEYAEEENYFYYHNCGYAYVHKGEIDENNGNYELALQDYDRAIEAYKKAVPLDPTGDDGSYTVGYAQDLKNKLLEKIGK